MMTMVDYPRQYSSPMVHCVFLTRPALNYFVFIVFSLNVSPPQPEQQRKFIVFEENLLQLFSICRECLGSTETFLDITGTRVKVSSFCKSGHSYLWNSQPMIGRRALGDIVLAASILYTGSSPTKVVRLMQAAGVCFFSLRSYNRMQTRLLIPAIDQVTSIQHAVTHISHTVLALQTAFCRFGMKSASSLLRR